uniref:Uncharacterized protein n=1 Tax=Oryza nivara TaxID=4536 RepID=A0A0E0GIR3_ORYNI
MTAEGGAATICAGWGHWGIAGVCVSPTASGLPVDGLLPGGTLSRPLANPSIFSASGDLASYRLSGSPIVASSSAAQREQKWCSVRRWVAVEVHCQEQLDERISMPICIKDAILCCQYKQ